MQIKVLAKLKKEFTIKIYCYKLKVNVFMIKYFFCKNTFNLKLKIQNNFK